MKLVDSHTHLYFSDSYDSPADAVQRAIDAGVDMMILPGVNAQTIQPVKDLHNKYPHNTAIGIGLHPSDVEPDTWREQLEKIFEELNTAGNQYVAVGEVGVDMHWETKYLDLQQQAFDIQARRALELDKPLIIHSRDAFDPTVEVLQGLPKVPRMVFHSYSGTPADTERLLGLFSELYFGINGIVTFKNAKIKNVLPIIPANQLLIETDAPYLAPTPHRGKTNESAFLVHTAQFVANELGLTFDELAKITTGNAIRLFRLEQ